MFKLTMFKHVFTYRTRENSKRAPGQSDMHALRASRSSVARGQQHWHHSVSAMELQPSVGTEPEPEPGMYHPGGQRDMLCERDEQEKLSGVVKRVHRKLRRKYIEGKAVSLSS